MAGAKGERDPPESCEVGVRRSRKIFGGVVGETGADRKTRRLIWSSGRGLSRAEDSGVKVVGLSGCRRDRIREFERYRIPLWESNPIAATVNFRVMLDPPDNASEDIKDIMSQWGDYLYYTFVEVIEASRVTYVLPKLDLEARVEFQSDYSLLLYWRRREKNIPHPKIDYLTLTDSAGTCAQREDRPPPANPYERSITATMLSIPKHARKDSRPKNQQQQQQQQQPRE
ncbi:hypothetical protein BKA80DRAFT_255656 [Phyllosticta citrichinensis]